MNLSVQLNLILPSNECSNPLPANQPATKPAGLYVTQAISSCSNKSRVAAAYTQTARSNNRTCPSGLEQATVAAAVKRATSTGRQQHTVQHYGIYRVKGNNSSVFTTSRLHPLRARQIAPFPALPLELTLLCCVQPGHAV